MDAKTRTTELLAEGKTGREIGKILIEERFTLDETVAALLDSRFVVAQEQICLDSTMLYVSDKPEQAGIRVLMMASHPFMLPSLLVVHA